VEYSLYIDESGESVPFRYKYSPYFILSGCIVEVGKTRDIIENLNHIKYKYWNRTDIVLHSVSIGRKEKEFSIFRDPRRFSDFIEDIEIFFQRCPISLIGVVTDQHAAHAANLIQKTVLRISYGHLFANYTRFLLAKRSKGQIIQEASIEIQDIIVYKEFHKYQSLGIPENNISSTEVKNHVTGLSFFTKKSNDSISQVADLLSYGLKVETLIAQDKKEASTLSNYQRVIRKSAKNKLFHIDPRTTGKKKWFYNNLEVLKNIP